MNLLHLRYFYEVAKTKSYTQSAKNLHISQPAISKMVKELEFALGHELIERRRNPLGLTKRGQDLFESASRIFFEERQIEERMAQSQKELHGSWCVGASDNLAVYLMPKVLGEFKLQHAQLRVSLFAGTSGQIKKELKAEHIRI